MKNDSTEQKTIKAAETAFDILELVAECGGASLSELASELDYSKSTTHYYLKTLEQRNYLLNDSNQYRLGLQLASLGTQSLQQYELYDQVRDQTDELAAETGFVAHVAVERNGQLRFLYQSTPEDSDGSDIHVGMGSSLHCTAYGKAILAELPDERVEELLADSDLRKRTRHTITSRNKLAAQLETTAELGVAFSGEEHMLGRSSIAAPILKASSGSVRGAIGVTGDADQIANPHRHIKARRFSEQVPDLIQRRARIIGDKLSDGS